MSAIAADRSASLPRRWTLHGLNSGAIFAATCRGVAILPRFVSYAIGDVGTWIAWRVMRETSEALVDNLRVVFPGETAGQLRQRALATLRSYARNVIDFLCAVNMPGPRAKELFVLRPADYGRFCEIRARGRGIIFVSGHYGNWEAGSVCMRHVFDLPLTILALPDDREEANSIRREIRDRLGTDTIEVRKSFDTALQIRRRLADNGIVAMLMDRHIGRDRIAVSLFGRRAWFMRTPALMGYLTGAPLVPCFIERRNHGGFDVLLGDPIDVDHEAPRDEAIQQAAQAFARQLEDRIRRHPDQWFHFYPYWKAQAGD
ncbi:MAG TPA: lysophospholipid acyltransferase family protein [Vicinamibacterales bacterium]|nr:lysophospholipid acyltransferase family protein [Vicinamibacterales bacterium]